MAARQEGLILWNPINTAAVGQILKLHLALVIMDYLNQTVPFSSLPAAVHHPPALANEYCYDQLFAW